MKEVMKRLQKASSEIAVCPFVSFLRQGFTNDIPARAPLHER